ncbi:hypothetical protein Scep_018887 [Stephania cephalantha]|uniref:Uncharacterized protein n=1 Tax=Stephania cephalantha TaxID=152367 RepID=A0AAP0NLM5_9MAGN
MTQVNITYPYLNHTLPLPFTLTPVHTPHTKSGDREGRRNTERRRRSREGKKEETSRSRLTRVINWRPRT